MTHYQYEAQRLKDLLEDLRSERVSGTLHLHARINPGNKPISSILVLKKGEITFAGTGIPQAEAFVRNLAEQFNPTTAEFATKFAIKNATNSLSVRSLLEQLVRIRTVNWPQIETFLQTQVVQRLEQLLPHPGSWQLDGKNQFDISYGEDRHGLALSKLLQEVTKRQQEWDSLAPSIPSMNAVPLLAENALSTISDLEVRRHLSQSIDGKRSLVEIAEKLERDPLELARSYLIYVDLGWIVFEGTTNQAQELDRPIILAVDDSPIIQTMLRRALSSRYHVVTAGSAMDALKIISSKPISLMILDVTMPQVDGLEFCRTVRSIPKFRKLPILMLTARDGFVDKLKGQVAGSTRYLTKPFEPEKLLEIVGEYV